MKALCADIMAVAMAGGCWAAMPCCAALWAQALAWPPCVGGSWAAYCDAVGGVVHSQGCMTCTPTAPTQIAALNIPAAELPLSAVLPQTGPAPLPCARSWPPPPTSCSAPSTACCPSCWTRPRPRRWSQVGGLGGGWEWGQAQWSGQGLLTALDARPCKGSVACAPLVPYQPCHPPPPHPCRHASLLPWVQVRT